MFCDIHTFYAATTITAKALNFSIQELAIVECLRHMQVKFLLSKNIFTAKGDITL